MGDLIQIIKAHSQQLLKNLLIDYFVNKKHFGDIVWRCNVKSCSVMVSTNFAINIIIIRISKSNHYSIRFESKIKLN